MLHEQFDSEPVHESVIQVDRAGVEVPHGSRGDILEYGFLVECSLEGSIMLFSI